MATIFKSFRKISFLFIVISFSFVSQVFSQQAETVTITTYYPAPMGVYENLRLFPIAAAQSPVCNANQEGTMYYNNDAGENRLMVCRETATGFDWEAVGASFWTQPAGTVFLHTNDVNWNVGVGTVAPARKMEVADTGTTDLDSIRVTRENHSAGIGIDRNGTFWGTGIYQDGVERLVLDSNFGVLIGQTYLAGNPPNNGLLVEGNVGIGTTTPDGRLDVEGGTTYLERLVIRPRAGTPSGVQNGEIWIVQ
ncbi:MAG: hypothetical protein M0R48_05300 [Candidatus Omnitrophica bacterium]|jgi:hypothetical protein|nr:hypothetical protein [Candidatus Omnitrophota bacterium]